MRQHRCDYCEARLERGHCSARCDESERERQGYQAEYDAGIAAGMRDSAERGEPGSVYAQAYSDAREAVKREQAELEREKREGARERRAESRLGE